MLRPTTNMGSLYNMNPPSSLGTPVLRYFYLMAQKSCLFWGRSSWQKCQFVCQYGDLRWPQATLHFRSVKLIYCFPLSFCDGNTLYGYFSPFHPFVGPLQSTGGGEFGVQKWYWLVSFPHLLPPVKPPVKPPVPPVNAAMVLPVSTYLVSYAAMITWVHAFWSQVSFYRVLFTLLGPNVWNFGSRWWPPVTGTTGYHGNRSEVSGTNVQAYFSSSYGRFDGF